MTALENLRVVLVASRNPLNIGAASRAMSNFGATHLRVVTPYSPAFREARSAVGASAVLAGAEECQDISQATSDCSLIVGTTAIRNRQPQQPLYDLPSVSAKLRKHLRSGRVALLFGSEKWGLSNESLSHCHWLVHIPTRKEHQSMNLAQAVAVCLYELSRASKGNGSKNQLSKAMLADMATADRIHAALLDALRESGYIAPRSSASAAEKLRRMLRRLNLGANDAEVFLGMLHKILWKLRQPK